MRVFLRIATIRLRFRAGGCGILREDCLAVAVAAAAAAAAAAAVAGAVAGSVAGSVAVFLFVSFHPLLLRESRFQPSHCTL